MSTYRKKTLKARDYLQSEEGYTYKKGKGQLSVALVYPNTYYLGMSNLGFQSVYALFNQDSGTVCERAFLPDESVANVFNTQVLRSLESGRAVGDFDCVAFSISFENDYLYLPHILESAGLPILAKDRQESDSIVLAGGAAITINPEPIRDFCDVLFVGEAEEAVAEITAVLKSGGTREQKILALGKIEGVYVCASIDFESSLKPTSSICPSYAQQNKLLNRVSLEDLRLYKRRVPANINDFAVQTQIYSPYSEFGKLSLIEVQRGCGRGCKFCAEGFIYTPFRQRDYALIQDQVREGLKYRNKIGLIGADLLVYPQITELMHFIHSLGGTFSPSSIRLDALTDEIVGLMASSGHRTIAVAPEAGAEELRKKLNKKFNNEAVMSSISKLVAAGIPNIKMYLMIGLPYETASDIEETLDLVIETRKRMNIEAKKSGQVGSLIVSLNPFIPKPRTPYQVGVFEGVEALEEKINRFKARLCNQSGVRLYYENPFFAFVQALLSNGKRQMSEYILSVYQHKGGLKKALATFNEY